MEENTSPSSTRAWCQSVIRASGFVARGAGGASPGLDGVVAMPGNGYHRLPPPYEAHYSNPNWEVSNNTSLEEYEETEEGVEEFESDSGHSLPPPPPRHTGDENGQPCPCPMCRLNHFTSFFFAHQRRSSPHVMAAFPSRCLEGRSLPPLPPIPDPGVWDTCPVFHTWGFCTHSIGCYLPHEPEIEVKLHGAGLSAGRGRPPLRRPLIQRGRSADEELDRLIRKAEKHRVENEWSCGICGAAVTCEYYSTVGETCCYRHCPECYFMCYLPEVTYLLEHLLLDCLDDYQRYKDEVERYRKLVPDEFKVPLSSEAFNIATSVFAWSLVSPKDIKEAVDAAYTVLPTLSCVVSVGSGIGYVEHLFNRVMNDADLPSCGPVVAWRSTVEEKTPRAFPSTIAKEKASFYGQRHVPIYAFDELSRRYDYSVHVSLGGPLSVLSVDCPNSVLLLCWPPFGSPTEEQSSMGYEALEYFRQRGGKVLIFIGDVSSSGDWRFHKLRDSHYKLVREYTVRREVRRWNPQKMGLIYAGNDTIGVYERC